MKKTLILFSLISLLSACGVKRKLPSGAPAYLKVNSLEEKIAEKAFDFQNLQIRGKGSVQSQSFNQSFRFEIRVLKDSIIWVDIADPFIGLKVARGILKPEGFSYYNRLERNYAEGKTQEMAAKLGIDFQFAPLMAALGANYWQTNGPRFQSFIPEAYLIHNYDPSGKVQAVLPQEEFISQEIKPEIFRPNYLEIKQATAGKIFRVKYLDYSDWQGFKFPKEVVIEYLSGESTIVKLEINSVEQSEKLSTPYSIPSNYDLAP